jgi:serine/threonine-protein kinase 19
MNLKNTTNQFHAALTEADIPLPSDTDFAISYLCTEFPTSSAHCLPFALKSQISSIIGSDKLDIELEVLKHSNAIKIFKIQQHTATFGIMRTNDYISALRQSIAATTGTTTPVNQKADAPTTTTTTSSTSTPLSLEVQSFLDAYIDKILGQPTQISISHQDILHTVHSQSNNTEDYYDTITIDKALLFLITEGYLARDTINICNYIFTMPVGSTVLKSIVSGRKEVLAIITKRRFKEMSEKELLKKRVLRSSVLGMKFHLRDMVGIGMLVKMDTTVGAMYRCS